MGSMLPYFVHCFFHLLLLHFPSYISLDLPLCNHDDSSALLQFKNTVAVDTSASKYRWWDQLCLPFPSKTASWENGTNCCRWDGITCDTMSGHVIGLDLTCSMLQGELHPNSTLFQLTHLQKLNLAFNDFSGSLMYSGIGDLVSLTHLNLSFSSFVGDIPSTISHLSKLVSLDLSGDLLDSNSRLRLDPSTWNKLMLNATNLEELVLIFVNMSSIRENSLSLLTNLSSSLVSLHMIDTGVHGNFPRDVLCIPNLQELCLTGNQNLRGKLPKSNWSVPLRLLDLSFTALCREVPDSLGHFKSLNELRLWGCQFEGLVPLALWNLTQLTHLDLSWNNLSGGITPLLSNFNHLMFLYLDSNNFSGHIPEVFGKFTRLKVLSLSENNLEGQLPSSLFDLTHLSGLSLSYNKLVGSIPADIAGLSKFRFLDLSYNFLNGTIPHWCYSLPSLLALILNDNNFSGSIGEFSTYSLMCLSVSNNKIQGHFPNSIFELENLTLLSLSSNELRGHLTFHKFSNFRRLVSLDLSHNFLGVQIDNSVDYILPRLEYLYLSHCNITNFPQFITTLQNLWALDLSHNKIEGVIPRLFNDNTNLTRDISSSILCNVSSLRILILSYNNLTGTIPQCLGTFPSLWVLDLQMNNLYGSIPGNFSKSNAFETIMLNDNLLEGPLPKSLSHCTNLEVLDLGNNYIQDVFPNWLETLPELQVLILRANKFHGIITSLSTKHPFPQLRIFDVSNNNFNGPLPTSYLKNFQGMMNVNGSQSGLEYMGRNDEYNDSVVVVMKGHFTKLERILTTFTTIDLSNNMLEGEIPHVIGELNSVRGLNLSHNAITGAIPRSLGNLTSLEWLDLSWNQLKGEIPTALTNLNFLSVLNLSQNQLEGVIPTGKQFNTFQNDSYGGNPMLCGTPLSKSCSHDEERPPSTIQHEEKLGFGWKPVAVGYICGVVFGMLLGCCFFLSGKPLWLARLKE